MLRFAPSPTGDMHISDLRVAILNYLVSQQKNDQFLVRIEDIDAQRNIEGKDSEIMMILEKFALKHDAVFHQSEHLNLYQTLALRLLKDKNAFVCQCTDKTLEEKQCSANCENLQQEDYAEIKASGNKFLIRLKKSEDIILDTNGMPSYNFACATDDMMSNIDCVIRDEKHLLNTSKQILIKKILGYENETNYIHIPSISNNKEFSIKSLFEQGFIPDAILNYLLLVGNSKAPKEIFTLPEAIKWFEINSILKSKVKFDLEKLRFINREHLKLMDDRQLSTLFGFADADIGKLAKVYLEECSTITELEERIRSIFTAKDFTGEWGEEMKNISELIASAPAFETFDKLQKYLVTKSQLTEETLLQVLPHLLTGTGDGPELSKIYPFIKSYILEVAS